MSDEMSDDFVSILERFFERTPFFERNEDRTVKDITLSLATLLQEAYSKDDPAAKVMIKTAWPQWEQSNKGNATTGKLNEDDALEIVARSLCFPDRAAMESRFNKRIDNQFELAVDALVTGNVSQLKELIETTPSLVHARSAFGHECQLLHYLGANGVEIARQKSPTNAPEIAGLLFEVGCEVDSECQCYGGGANSTVLCLTVSSVHPYQSGTQAKLVACYLAAGAVPDGKLDDGAPLQTALSFGYLDAAKALVKGGAQVRNVVVAAGLGDVDGLIEQVQQLDSPNANIAYTDPFGREIKTRSELLAEAVAMATKVGQLASLVSLLELGADPSQADISGTSPLHWAAAHGQVEVVNWLLSHGANPAAKDQRWGATPDRWAANNGHEAIFKLLSAAIASDPTGDN